MRLINADNFLKQYSDQVRGDTIDAVDLRLALLYEPKVNAIPIEWIKKYYTDITSPYTDTRIQFEEMIRKWERENDKI